MSNFLVNRRIWLVLAAAAMVGLLVLLGIAYFVFSRAATDLGGWSYDLVKNPVTDQIVNVSCTLRERKDSKYPYLETYMSYLNDDGEFVEHGTFGISIGTQPLHIGYRFLEEEEGTVTCKIRFDDKPHTAMVFKTPIGRYSVIFQEPHEALVQLLACKKFAVEVPEYDGMGHCIAVFELRGLANCIRKMEADTGIKIIDKRRVEHP